MTFPMHEPRPPPKPYAQSTTQPQKKKQRFKFETALQNLTKRALTRVNPVLAEKASLGAKGIGRTADLFLKTWMGKLGIIIIFIFLAIALYGTFVIPPYTLNPADGLLGPSSSHPFGTDQNGVDVLDRVMKGSLASLTIGFTAMAVSMALGALVGLASGYWGGWRDEVIMRINDVFLSIPWLVLMIVIAAILATQSIWAVVLVIGLTGWSTTARIVRSQVLSLKSRQFVERAKAIGSSEWHIIRRHIFPNVVPLLFANGILTIAVSILSESTLSFLGLGPQDVDTWGRILEDAYNQGSATIPSQNLFIIMPGLAIVVVVLGFTFIGYAMDEVLNPKLRKR
jgi:peptide/nickel transport system permease protein